MTAGRIQTVTGAIGPHELGRTSIHEHLLTTLDQVAFQPLVTANPARFLAWDQASTLIRPEPAPRQLFAVVIVSIRPDAALAYPAARISTVRAPSSAGELLLTGRPMPASTSASTGPAQS